ncbi:MAG: phage holin family protein [Proteobacteria bacterium]|nr:phage holin family protein [Pseudomonadota bacterium]
MGEPEPQPPPSSQSPASDVPPLDESARAIYRAARTLAGAWSGQFAALRALLAADLALAGSALVQGLILLVAAAVVLATAWALLAGLAVWALHRVGLDWGWAIVIPMAVSVAVGALAIWRAQAALRLADLAASRQQAAAWFGGEHTATSRKPDGTP